MSNITVFEIVFWVIIWGLLCYYIGLKMGINKAISYIQKETLYFNNSKLTQKSEKLISIVLERIIDDIINRKKNN